MTQAVTLLKTPPREMADELLRRVREEIGVERGDGRR